MKTLRWIGLILLLFCVFVGAWSLDLQDFPQHINYVITSISEGIESNGFNGFLYYDQAQWGFDVLCMYASLVLIGVIVYVYYERKRIGKKIPIGFLVLFLLPSCFFLLNIDLKIYNSSSEGIIMDWRYQNVVRWYIAPLVYLAFCVFEIAKWLKFTKAPGDKRHPNEETVPIS